MKYLTNVAEGMEHSRNYIIIYSAFPSDIVLNKYIMKKEWTTPLKQNTTE